MSKEKEEVKQHLLQFPDKLTIENIHFSVIEKIIEELGWELDWDSFDSNGWQHDVDFIVKIPDKDFEYRLSSSWYYQDTCFYKVIPTNNG